MGMMSNEISAQHPLTMLQRLTRLWPLVAVGLPSAAAVIFLQLNSLNQLQASRTEERTRAEYQREAQQEAAAMTTLNQLPALGFGNLLSDWAFLRFLQYYGDDLARENTSYQLSPEFFKGIVERDPHFLQIYPYLFSSVAINAGKPEQAVALMDKGLQQLTPQTAKRAYYGWRFRGMTELLFLGDAQAAQQSFNQAAEWASQFTDPESQSVAQSSRQTAQFLANNPASKEAQVSAWFMVLTAATDQSTQKLAINRLEALGGRVVFTGNRVEVRF